MAKTTNKYGFNLPDGGDMVSPSPYNENFKKIEKVLSRIDKINVVKGTYIGNGDIKTHGVEAVQNIELGARPCLVWVGRKNMNIDSMCTLTFSRDTSYSEHKRSTYTTEEHIRARITDNGFDVIQYGFYDKSCVNDTQSMGLNRSGDEYYYIALFSDELDGTDAEAEYTNVDPYTMVFRKDVTSIPSAAATGEVYRIANDIYSDVVVAVSGVSGGSSDGYFLTVNISDTDTEFYRFFRTLYHKYYSLGVISLELNTYGQYVAIELQGVGEDYIKFGVANADIDAAWFTDGMYLFFRATNEIKEYASLEYACGECVCYVDGVWKRLGAEAVPYLVKRLAELEDAIAGGEFAGETSGGFRKIGFTEDCDFVATVEDGLTAFKDAVNAASDGETFLVMPGVYKGLSQFNIVKDINFIGIGMPRIEFPVWISGGGVFSYENWAWETVYDSITSKWDGFRFTGDFTVGLEANPDNQGYSGKAILSDCDLVGNSVTMCGSAKNCTFDVVAFTSGHYYGAGNCCTEFDGCTIKASGSFDASSCFDRFIRCDIYPISENTYISTEWYDIKTFVGCRMYALGASLSIRDGHSENANLNDTIVYANSISGTSGGYLVKPTEL